MASHTHLTSHTADACSQRLNALMNGYRIGWPAAMTAPTGADHAQPAVQPGAQP